MKITVPEIVSAGMYNARIAYKGKSKSMNRKTSMFELELPIISGGTSYIDTDNILLEGPERPSFLLYGFIPQDWKRFDAGQLKFTLRKLGS